MKQLIQTMCIIGYLFFVGGCGSQENTDDLSNPYKKEIAKLNHIIDSLSNSNNQLLNKLPYSIYRNYTEKDIPKLRYSYKSFRDANSKLLGLTNLKDSIIISPQYSGVHNLSMNIAALYSNDNWLIYNCQTNKVLFDSLKAVSKFQSGVAAIMHHDENIQLIDTTGIILNENYYADNSRDILPVSKMQNLIFDNLQPREYYYFLYDYIDHKKLYQDSIRHRMNIRPDSGGLYVQKLLYGLHLFFYTGMEYSEYYFRIPNISMEQAYLLSLKLHIFHSLQLSKVDYSVDGIQYQYFNGDNHYKVRITKIDSVYVEISRKG